MTNNGIGPDYVTIKHCNHCIYYTCEQIGYYMQTHCNHPLFDEPRFIQEFRHTWVETRDWCPCLKHGDNHA